MKTQYAVYNPSTGENVKYETIDEALDSVLILSLELFKSYSHNTLFTFVDIEEDGTEKWYNQENQDITLQLKIIERMKKARLKVKESIPVERIV